LFIRDRNTSSQTTAIVGKRNARRAAPAGAARTL
jgi:hypothetical protein